ncbi:MAG TPA: hypothetical protein VKX96_15660, partial [Chloroflexota bacterium]|nr:hypothetical protein [Chloroflexota bacterium]
KVRRRLAEDVADGRRLLALPAGRAIERDRHGHRWIDRLPLLGGPDGEIDHDVRLKRAELSLSLGVGADVTKVVAIAAGEGEVGRV